MTTTTTSTTTRTNSSTCSSSSHQEEGPLGWVCERIVDRCLQDGSQDNMTIIIVLLGEAGQKLLVEEKSILD